ncbi:FAD-dependent oxidoreductase [soil metagenome]
MIQVLNIPMIAIIVITAGIARSLALLVTIAASIIPEMRTDVLIVGGGIGGTAAALAAAEAGAMVVMTEPTEWIGGQLTSQAVPPDEHPWIESFGRTERYADFRRRVRAKYGLPGYRGNPGGGWVSALCHEPRVGHEVLGEMVASYVADGRLTILHGIAPTAAYIEGDIVRSVSFGDLVVEAGIFLDATELGDLLPLTGTEYVVGAESRRETGEPGAPDLADPYDVQGFTWCMVLSNDESRDWTYEKPAGYERWKAFRPEFWPGPLLGFEDVDPITLQPRHLPLYGPFPSLFEYRKIVDGPVPATVVNWPMNDYFLGRVIDEDAETVANRERESRELSLCLLHWLQTEAPRHDGGTGYPGLHLRGDLTGTRNGLAMAPYHRESRRIRAKHTIREQDVSSAEHPHADRAPEMPRSVGVGAYRIDLHPSTSGRNYYDVGTLPFQIPLGSLLPVRVRNLIAAGKNIGTTHITNGCYRLHPVEWNIGESAGTLAAFCLRTGYEPAHVLENDTAFSDFERQLQSAAVETAWPRLRSL